jgi:AcrR family transcriptional regulator
VSPQRSNRSSLIEGTLRCLERLPPERVTARAIARESAANLASIGYHFGSKDELVTEAAIAGLDRWLVEIEAGLASLGSETPETRFRRALEIVERTRERHTGLARNYLGAVAKGQHEPRIKARLAAGFRDSRPKVAALLGLGDDEAGEDAGGLVLSLFHGLLMQGTLDPALAIEGARMERAQARLARAWPRI